ncbi:MAG TPA: peptide deformylase [Candidatus Methylacidiphilales bacterium]|jgi:peptide deformylase|nr:peptide deformylase [Candidatus Methylacidiphilales bacterium]
MIREIVHYDAPVLRAKGRPVGAITPEIKALVEDLLDTMRNARGVGLAAQQIGEAIQVAVVDVTGIKERPSKMWIAGEPVDPEIYMPLVLINPALKPTKTKIISHEGCLSFPGLTLDIARAQRVSVTTGTLDGGLFEFDAGGLLGRAVLHEVDHLHGKLFIDHLDAEERRAIREDLEYIRRGEPIPERSGKNDS